MPSPFEDARNHALIGRRLSNWLRTDPKFLNDVQDPRTGYTLLGTAVAAGYPDQVEQLLENGAKANLRCKFGETPLLLAVSKARFERPLLVETILRYMPRESIDGKVLPAGIDDTYRGAGGNTPLMLAIQNLDADCIRLLVEAGARTHIKNDAGADAKELAEYTNKGWVKAAIIPGAEKSFLGRVVANVVEVGRHVFSWVDKQSNGFLGKMFNFRGGYSKETEKKLKARGLRKRDPAEPRPEAFVKDVDALVKNNAVLNVFFKDSEKNKDFIQKMASKLVDLANDPTTDLGNPEVLPKTMKVTMHRQVIYCDDSGSMVNRKGTAEQRWARQKEFALRTARVTTRVLPETEGVALYFINQRRYDSPSLDLANIEKVLDSVYPGGDTNIGTTLRDRILQPLVFGPLGTGTLTRPLLVTIITDGGPEPEAKSTLADVIVECGDRLEAKGYPRGCVKFLIGQIGSSDRAVEFLDSLKADTRITAVTHVVAGRLDTKYKENRNERKLDRWLVETLFIPIASAEAIR